MSKRPRKQGEPDSEESGATATQDPDMPDDAASQDTGSPPPPETGSSRQDGSPANEGLATSQSEGAKCKGVDVLSMTQAAIVDPGSDLSAFRELPKTHPSDEEFFEKHYRGKDNFLTWFRKRFPLWTASR